MGTVRRRGKKWYYRIELPTVDGKRKRIERVGGDTKKEALAALRRAEEELESCGSVTEESNISLSDFLDLWFENYVERELAYRTNEYYRHIIDAHIKPAMGFYKLKNITPLVLQDFLNMKKTNGFSKNSVINMKSVLGGAFKYAVVPAGLIKQNPMLNVSVPSYDTYEDRKKETESENKTSTLSADEIKEIFDRFPEDSNLYLPIQIAYHTGMRGGEVCALQWNDIDFNNKIIHVKHTLVNKGRGIFELGPTKTKGSKRDILMGDTLINILKKWRTKQKENRLSYGSYYTLSDFVCTKENGTPITTNSIKYLSRIVNYELKINFNFHMFRHTHATMLVASGASFKDIQARLGHSNIETTMNLYADTSDILQQDTIDKFESLVNSL